MKKFSALIMLGIGALTAGCSSVGDGSAEVPVIDLKANFACPDTGDPNGLFEVVAALCPAVTDSTLLSHPQIAGVDGNMIYLHDPQGGLMVFDMMENRCVSSFNHEGEGPGEYIYIGDAWKSPESDGWTVFDLSGKKIFGYTYDGKFKYEIQNDSISSLYPCGDGWLAANSGLTNNYQVYWFYSADWAKKGRLDTGLRYKRNDYSGIVPTRVVCDARTYLVENDTVYDFSEEMLKSVLAFESGNEYKGPDIVEADKKNRMFYKPVFSSNYAMVTSVVQDEKLCSFQIYRLSDGKLLFSTTMSL
ncbi:MAG: 6-bladed beta-propeller [Paramuribaculum sp.]|nr:6-bladed beta-propeller [Paramuribaculum sp.]